jgi:hypothetical protein
MKRDCKQLGFLFIFGYEVKEGFIMDDAFPEGTAFTC